ncbi:negative elongation factor E, partial [Biomphalaria pfeifferi]
NTARQASSCILGTHSKLTTSQVFQKGVTFAEVLFHTLRRNSWKVSLAARHLKKELTWALHFFWRTDCARSLLLSF